MAANYWASTQRRHWQFSRETLAEIRQKLEDDDRALVQQYPLPDRRLLSHFFRERTQSHLSLNAADLLIGYVRAGQVGEEAGSEATGSSHSTSVSSQILQQSGDSPHEPLPRPGYCVVFGLQDGRMPSAYQSCCERSTFILARFVTSIIHQFILAEEKLSRFHRLGCFQTRRMRILLDL